MEFENRVTSFHTWHERALKEDDIHYSVGIKGDAPIYKYMDFEGVTNMFSEQYFLFKNPSKWKDPFERRFFSADYSKLNFKVPTTYCSCFTQRESNEASWIMYSHNKKGINRIAVRVEIDKSILFGLLGIIKDYDKSLKIHFGEVYYNLNDNDLSDIHKPSHYLHNDYFNDFDVVKYTELLFLKRQAFEYESECRIILITNNDQNDSWKIGYDEFLQMIRSIIVSPFATDAEFKEIESKLRALVGDKIGITRSDLYDKRDEIIIGYE